MRLRALIADDEPLARERLRFLLSGQDEVEVGGECRNGREVIAALRESRFDVLFLDIQMPGKDGFDVIEQIGTVHMPVTVFVTAHNHYAVQAFEVHALDYLTKPVEPERLQATLLRVRERIASQAALVTQEQLKSVLTSLENRWPRLNFPQRLLVHNGSQGFFCQRRRDRMDRSGGLLCLPARWQQELPVARDHQAAVEAPRSG